MPPAGPRCLLLLLLLLACQVSGAGPPPSMEGHQSAFLG
jgi:hypothetical protein